MDAKSGPSEAGFTARQAGLLRAAGAASVAVALALIALKLWAWRMTDSVAVLSSLADSLLDLIASLITLFAVRVAITPADHEHRFGHGKSEAIASFAQALIVSGSALYVGVEAIRRLLVPAGIAEPGIGAAAMIVSLFFTIALVAFQRYVVRHTASLAVSADAMHYKSDILTTLAVLAAIFLSARLGWHVADPVLGLAVVGVVLASVRKIALEALDVLLDRELPADAREQIRALAASHARVLGVHDIRTRSSGATQFVQLHLELEPSLTLQEAHEIANEVERRVQQRLPRAQVLIHTDPYGYPEPRDPF